MLIGTAIWNQKALVGARFSTIVSRRYLTAKPPWGIRLKRTSGPDGKIAAAISVVVDGVIQLVVGHLLVKEPVEPEGDFPA